MLGQHSRVQGLQGGLISHDWHAAPPQHRRGGDILGQGGVEHVKVPVFFGL